MAAATAASSAANASPSSHKTKLKVPPPERWLKCPRRGKTVADTPFVPFKVPLDDRYDIPPEDQWTLEMLLSRFDKMTLIIDLTKKATDGFYSSKNLPEGVIIRKIACEGYGSCPTQERVDEFTNVCEAWWRKHPDGLIGVHCTHGFNRTGFMIAAFLVEKRNCAPELALKRFQDARPPGILKDHYIEEFCERYDGTPDGFVPVVLPEWHVVEEPDAEDLALSNLAEYLQDLPDDTTLEGEVQQRLEECVQAALLSAVDATLVQTLEPLGWKGQGFRHPESVNISKVKAAVAQLSGGSNGRQHGNPRAANCESTAAVPLGAFAFKHPSIEAVPPPRQGPLRKRCREMIGARAGATFAGAQPVSFERSSGDMLGPEYYVSWKADGTRYLLMILGKEGTFMVGRDNTVFKVDLFFRKMPADPAHPPHPDKAEHINNTLVDGELVLDKWFEKDKTTGKPVKRRRYRFLVFDLIAFNGQSYCKSTFAARREVLEKQVLKPRESYLKQTSREVMGVRLKQFWKLEDFDKVKVPKTHASDGYVFTKNDTNYEPGSCATLFKWKQPELNSVDFLMQFIGEEGGKVHYELRVADGRDSVMLDSSCRITAPAGTPPAKSLEKCSGKIVECVLKKNARGDDHWAPLEDELRPLGLRNDKTHPNSLRTAQSVYRSIKAGVTLPELRRMIKAKTKQASKHLFDTLDSAAPGSKRQASESDSVEPDNRATKHARPG